MPEIKKDPQNYRMHDKRNKEVIAKSLSECGAGRSILLDSEDGIIAGNGVFEQAEKLNIPVKIIETDGTELIAVKRTDLKPEDEKRRNLSVMDNSTSDLSTWDWSRLTGDFDEPSLYEMGIEIPNFSMGKGFGETEETEIEITLLFPIEVMANEEDYARFNRLKELRGVKKDVDLVRAMMELLEDV